MRKHWVALLSVLGLTGSVVQMESQVIKGKPPASNETVKPGSTAQKTANSGKLAVKQQTLRQQKQSTGVGGKQADPLTPSAYCQGKGNANKAVNKGGANNATPPPAQKLTLKQESLRNATDKSAGQLTKGNQQLTKGNQQLTKGNQQLTKGNQQLTKGNQQLTKGNQAIPK